LADIQKKNLLWNNLASFIDPTFKNDVWYEKSSFHLIKQKAWPPQAILVSGWLISKNLLWNCFTKWTETWWEAPMEGSVLSFLKAEWKVSDTDSAHWASSFSELALWKSNSSCWSSTKQTWSSSNPWYGCKIVHLQSLP